MSKKRYRTRPGQPRNEAEAMVRALAMELLDGSLRELEQEIAVLQVTVDLYYAEARERRDNPSKDQKRWQVAPGVGLRAVAMLRRVRKERDAMLAEAEQEIVDEHLSAGVKQQVEAAQQPAHSRPHADPSATASAKAGEAEENPGTRSNHTNAAKPAKPKPNTAGAGKQSSVHEPARSRDPAAAA